MSIDGLLSYLKNPLFLAGLAIGASHLFERVTRALAKRANTTADTEDDIVAAKWVARSGRMRVVTDALVRWFVPQAFAPTREEPLPPAPGIERVEGEGA